MNEITTVGLDLAKSVFQLHAVDARGVVRLRRQCRRGQLLATLAQLPKCLVAMEACASAHYWGRQIQQLGHTVMLIAPQYVKPFVRGDKSDRNDAQGICEAALRPGMPQVALKSEEQQAVLSLHRMRELLEKQRKQVGNQLRGLLAEFGVVMPTGVSKLRAGLADAIERVPVLLRPALHEAARRLSQLEQASAEHQAQIEQFAQLNPVCRRLMKERGIGPLTASAFVATIGSPAYYRNGRQLAASLGLVPRQHSTGGKAVLMGITKRGDRYLRMLLIHGGRAVLRHVPGKSDPLSCWLQQLVQRRGMNRASVAMANKNARHLWAIWRTEGAALAME